MPDRVALAVTVKELAELHAKCISLKKELLPREAAADSLDAVGAADS